MIELCLGSRNQKRAQQRQQQQHILSVSIDNERALVPPELPQMVVINNTPDRVFAVPRARPVMSFPRRQLMEMDPEEIVLPVASTSSGHRRMTLHERFS